MLNSLIKERLGRFGERGNRPNQLLLLAVSVMAFGVVALTVASSLFLTHVGATYLPVSYLLMGVLSLPAYAWLSQVVDRTNRIRLCQFLLVLAAMLTLLLRLLLVLDSVAVYYALHIGFFFQWILVPEVLFPSLVSDYFTALDWKRYAPLLKMAMAVGGLLGGGLTTLLATRIAPQNILWVVPVLYGVTFAQLAYLERSQIPLAVDGPPEEKGFVENLREFPSLLGKYPIISFLASSTFFFIILYSVAEFEYLSIYARAFPDSQALARFLGLIRSANNILPLLILYFFTRPSIERWGVARMNLVYPLTTLGSFAGLALNLNLSAAICTNLNADALDDSLNQPIHNLNYNAVPHQIVGRVRAIGNGAFYSLGLAIAGGLLWFSKSVLMPLQLAQIAIALSVAFLLIRYQMGKSYLRSLLAMLQSGSAKLEQVGEGLTRLPASYSDRVRPLLASADRNDQILGLELARRANNPSQFLPVVKMLLQNNDGTLDRALLQFFSTAKHPQLIEYLQSQLAARTEAVKLLVLEALIACRHPLEDAELQLLCRSENPQIKALAYLALQESNCTDAELKASYSLFWLSELEDKTARRFIRGVCSTGDRQHLPLLRDLIANASPEVKRDGLNALSELAQPGDESLAAIAVGELAHLNPLVRAAALKLLSVVRSPDLLPQIARGLEHPNLAVRLGAASAIATYGDRGLPAVEPFLHAPRLEVVEAAIAAIGKIRTHRAEEVLFNYLKPDYSLVDRSRSWLQQIPKNNFRWRSLELSIKDYHERLIHRVLYVLSNLDREGTHSFIRRILNTQDARQRANALETLASLRYRRFVLPILPLFEQEGEACAYPPLAEADMEVLRQTAAAASDHWIRIGAMLVAGKLPLPHPAIADPDRLLRVVLEIDTTTSYSGEATDPNFLPRVFFLKILPLFSSLFLDELLLANCALEQKVLLAGETIDRVGLAEGGLLIVYRGSLFIKERQTKIALIAGQSWGEMGLFGDTPPAATAIAATDCILLFLSRLNFERLIDRYPRLLMGFSPASSEERDRPN